MPDNLNIYSVKSDILSEAACGICGKLSLHGCKQCGLLCQEHLCNHIIEDLKYLNKVFQKQLRDKQFDILKSPILRKLLLGENNETN